MQTESVNSSSEPENQTQLERGLEDMISHLNSQLTHLKQAQEDDETGVRIITIAGTNSGSTLKSELGANPSRNKRGKDDGGDSNEVNDDDEETGTLVNSNFQAVNNSIMLGGSFNSNDPGVKVEIYDDVDHPRHQQHRRHGHEHKGKEKTKD